MSWLARLEVDADTVRKYGVSDDIYAWHKMLWECHPNEPEAKRDFLTRIDQLDGVYRLWIMAKRKPRCPRWCPPDGLALKEIALVSYAPLLCFRSACQPTKCWFKEDPVKRLCSKRTQWRNSSFLKRQAKAKAWETDSLVEPEELRAWLIHKGEVRCKKWQRCAWRLRILEGKLLKSALWWKVISQRKNVGLSRRRSVSRGHGSDGPGEVCRNI